MEAICAECKSKSQSKSKSGYSKESVTCGLMNMSMNSDDGVVRRYSHDDCMMSRRGPGYEAAETALPRYVGRRFR